MKRTNIWFAPPGNKLTNVGPKNPNKAGYFLEEVGNTGGALN